MNTIITQTISPWICMDLIGVNSSIIPRCHKRYDSL